MASGQCSLRCPTPAGLEPSQRKSAATPGVEAIGKSGVMERASAASRNSLTALSPDKGGSCREPSTSRVLDAAGAAEDCFSRKEVVEALDTDGDLLNGAVVSLGHWLGQPWPTTYPMRALQHTCLQFAATSSLLHSQTIVCPHWRRQRHAANRRKTSTCHIMSAVTHPGLVARMFYCDLSDPVCDAPSRVVFLQVPQCGRNRGLCTHVSQN